MASSKVTKPATMALTKTVQDATAIARSPDVAMAFKPPVKPATTATTTTSMRAPMHASRPHVAMVSGEVTSLTPLFLATKPVTTPTASTRTPAPTTVSALVAGMGSYVPTSHPVKPDTNTVTMEIPSVEIHAQAIVQTLANPSVVMGFVKAMKPVTMVPSTTITPSVPQVVNSMFAAMAWYTRESKDATTVMKVI